LEDLDPENIYWYCIGVTTSAKLSGIRAL